MSSADHLPHKNLKLGGLKFLRGLIFWRGKNNSTKDISAILDVTSTYYREVYEGKYCSYKSALNYYEHKSDMEVMLDYIRFTGVHQADKSVVLDYYTKRGMEKPKARRSSAQFPVVMATFEKDAATPLVARDNSAFSKAAGRTPVVPH